MSKADRSCNQDNQEHYCHDKEITLSIISLLGLWQSTQTLKDTV